MKLPHTRVPSSAIEVDVNVCKSLCSPVVTNMNRDKVFIDCTKRMGGGKRVNKVDYVQGVLKREQQHRVFSKTAACFHFCSCQKICYTVTEIGCSWIWFLPAKLNEGFSLTSSEIQREYGLDNLKFCSFQALKKSIQVLPNSILLCKIWKIRTQMSLFRHC